MATLYATNFVSGFPGILLRGFVSTILLLPPTVLMGATLPVMGRWLEASPGAASQLGFIYSGNTVGAVLGCLMGGLYLLRVYDLATATYVAVALNLALALVSFCAAALVSHTRPISERPPPTLSLATSKNWPVYVAIGLSGVSALGAEVVWTRLLSLLLGPTVYSFSIILACFLMGLGIGSGIGAFVARRVSRPRVALGWCQLMLTAAIAFAAYLLNEFFPQQLSTAPPDLAAQFESDVTRSLLTILPATCLWGASFPLALAATAPRAQDPGQLVGRIYAANTAGAIVGALATSLILMAWLGTHNLQRLFIAASALAAILMFMPSLQPSPPGRASGNRRSKEASPLVTAMPILATFTVAWLLAKHLAPVPGLLVAFGKYAANMSADTVVLYAGEGMNASVAVSQSREGVRSFHVSGKIEASSDKQDMQLQRMLGQLPALIHSRPRSVLVVGCGSAVTAGSFVPFSGIERITIVDIEPLIPQEVPRFFRQENHDVLRDPRSSVVFDDARHYVLTTADTFDIITSDPIHPWVKGSASLYSKEYFEIVKRHLNPGGVVSQWVPLYESTEEVVKSEIATFLEVFPNGTIWSNEPVGSDLVLIGQADPAPIDIDMIQERAGSPTVAGSLRAAGFSSAVELLATYTGGGADLKPWLDGSQINRDRSLRLQYLAGIRMGHDDPEEIYETILSWRKAAHDLFVGSEGSKQALERAMIERLDRTTR